MDTDPHVLPSDEPPTPFSVAFSAATDLKPSSLVDAWWMHTASARGYSEFTYAIRLIELEDLKPTTLEGLLPEDARVVRRVFFTSAKKQDAAVECGGALANVSFGAGQVWLGVAAHDATVANDVKDRLLASFPEGVEKNQEPAVPLVVWTDSRADTYGGQLNRFKVRSWEEMIGNYAPETTAALQPLFEGFKPGDNGKLLLWHGEPGTGKTYALGALSYAWRDWCSIHYIADPENFLGNPDYLLTLLAAHPGKDKEWKLVILEDTGELLTADAPSREGQSLSRLLNTTDGMLGQGSNTLFLISTNEPVSSFHGAVSRPGRCAALIEFHPLARAQAVDWLREHDAPARAEDLPEATTVAELYSVLAGKPITATSHHPVGFAPM